MIAFNKFYNHFNIVSTLLITISLILLIFKGLNFGIDFKGGTLIELRSSDTKINVTTLRDKFNQMNLGDISVKKLRNKGIPILGSAHNLKEINQKIKQGIQIIFLSPLFKVEKTNKFLNIIKFNIHSKLFPGDVVALGGIRKNNINRVKILNCFGFASISYIKTSIKKWIKTLKNSKKK